MARISKASFKMKGPSLYNSPIKKDEKYDPMKTAGTMTDEGPETQGPVKPANKTVATKERKSKTREGIIDLEDKIEFLQNDIDELSGDQSKAASAKTRQMMEKVKSYRAKIKILRNA